MSRPTQGACLKACAKVVCFFETAKHCGRFFLADSLKDALKMLLWGFCGAAIGLLRHKNRRRCFVLSAVCTNFAP